MGERGGRERGGGEITSEIVEFNVRLSTISEEFGVIRIERDGLCV